MITELPAASLDELRDLRITLHRHHAALGDPPGFVPRDEDDAWQAWAAKTRRMLDDDRGAILGHVEDGRITGYASVALLDRQQLVRPVLEPRGTHAELVTLVVADGQRGRRIGEQLMDAARTWARGRGAATLHIVVRGNNPGALRFYERQGAQAAFTTLLLDL